MRNKISVMFFCLTMIAFCFSLLPAVKSVAVAGPAVFTLNYEPGTIQSIPYVVRNNYDVAMGADIEINAGVFNGSVTSDVTHVELMQPGEKLAFTVTIKMPQKRPEPGLHVIDILVTENRQSGGGSMAARGAITKFFYVRVPQEGIYADAQITATNTAVNKSSTITVKANNYGTETISSASADITIIDLEKKTVAKLSTDSVFDIESFKSAEMSTSWTTQKQGTYTAFATLNYDGHKAYANTTFIVGEKFLRIANYSKELPSGTIVKFIVTLANEWDSEIRGAYASFELRKDTQSSGEKKTDFTNIGAFSSSDVSVELDTRNYAPGIYDITIKANDFDKSYDVINGKITFSGNETNQTEKVTLNGEIPKKGIKLNVIIIGILVFIVLIAIAYLVYKKRLSSEK